MVEVTVARLGLDSTSNSYVVVLREKDGSRLLPIWIGQPEAESIVMQMNDWKRERPLTHDLCKSLIVALGAQVRRVSITRIEKGTYYAEIRLEGPMGHVQIDARPSDSIAIALRVDAPIFASEELLNTMDEDESPTAGDSSITPSTAREMSADQLKNYLANLRPEDFGKFNP